MLERKNILVLGAGDLATGVIRRLRIAGARVVATELAAPVTVRRLASLSEAVWSGRHTVEGATAVRCSHGEIDAVLAAGEIPLLVDPDRSILRTRGFDVLVDARMAKANLGTRISDAPAVIGIGPGFTAGSDCHAVIETLQGAGMGKVILKGQAAADTGEPCSLSLAGAAPDPGLPADLRVLRSPVSGTLHAIAEIGDIVEPGAAVAEVEGIPVVSAFKGVLRGLVHDGVKVPKGLKIGEVDLTGKVGRCARVSEKANAVAGGVLEACFLLQSGGKRDNRGDAAAPAAGTRDLPGMSRLYDRGWVSAFFDAYAEKEWKRLEASPTEEVKLHVHRLFLEKRVRRGDRVLELGPGPGRFTEVLACIGAEVTAVDVSPVQLDLHRRYALERGFESAVRARHLLDMCDLSTFPSESFDAVVCFGGPLSYVFERRREALAEILRVLVPGGCALVSVMSTWGAVHEYLDEVIDLPQAENAGIISTGNLHPSTYSKCTHRCHMFRASELQAVLEEAGFEDVVMSASNCLTPVWRERLAEVRKDPSKWSGLLGMETEACMEHGCLDLGTHVIAAARRPA